MEPLDTVTIEIELEADALRSHRPLDPRLAGVMLGTARALMELTAGLAFMVGFPCLLMLIVGGQ